MSEVIKHSDGSIEWPCLVCGEPILMFPGDTVDIKVGKGGAAVGAYCTKCVATQKPGEPLTEDEHRYISGLIDKATDTLKEIYKDGGKRIIDDRRKKGGDSHGG